MGSGIGLRLVTIRNCLYGPGPCGCTGGAVNGLGGITGFRMRGFVTRLELLRRSLHELRKRLVFCQLFGMLLFRVVHFPISLF